MRIRTLLLSALVLSAGCSATLDETSAPSTTTPPTQESVSSSVASTTTLPTEESVVDEPEIGPPPVLASVAPSIASPSAVAIERFFEVLPRDFSDISPDGKMHVRTNSEGLCVVAIEQLTGSCNALGDLSSMQVFWSPDSSALLLDEVSVPGPLEIYAVSEEGQVSGPARTLSSEIQFIAWGNDSSSIVARVGGALAMVDVDSGDATPIGEVVTPFDATVTNGWLWYSAPGEVTAIHESGYTARFDAADSFAISGTDADGGIMVGLMLVDDLPGVYVFEARTQSTFVIPVPTDGLGRPSVVLSPDGQTLVASARSSSGEDELFSASIEATTGAASPWNPMGSDLWAGVGPLAVWIEPNVLRVQSGRALSDIEFLE